MGPGPTTAPPARREVLPYLLASLFAFATLPLPPQTGAQVGHVLAAVVVVLAAGTIAVLGLERHWGPWLQALPAYLYLVAVALLRDAEGGAPSGFGMLVLLTLTWLALHAGRAQLVVGIGLMAAMFAIPILVVGEPEYPASEWRRMLLWVLVGTIAAWTMQGLVQRVRGQAASADRQARTDALTGLPNRRELERVLAAELDRAVLLDAPLCVAMVDLDRFKSYNDTHGHAAGDELLAAAANAWRTVVRRGDVVARYGGEEFTVVLPGCDPDAARTLLDRFRRATPRGQTCSIGLAAWDRRESVDQLVARADARLYEAKRNGRDRIVS